MFTHKPQILFTTLSLLLSLTTAQLTTLPQCIQTCITTQSTCTLTSIYCLCQATNEFTTFLPDLVTCISTSCPSISIDLLLTPLQLACQIDGEPIPGDVLSSAENAAGGGGGGKTSVVTTTFTVSREGSRGGTTTVTSLITLTPTPISVETTSTTATPSNTLSPVVITTTNSVGSTYTSQVSNPGASSGTRTSSIPITFISRSSTSVASRTTTTSAVKETETSSITSVRESSSKTTTISTATSKTSNPKQTDSAPFTDTNSGAVKVGYGGVWIWAGLLLGGMAFVGL